MNERQLQELALLRTRFPDLEFLEEGMWVRIPSYPIPGDLWNTISTAVAFQIPPSDAQEPYGFYVPKELALRSGAPIQNHTDGSTPFDGLWAKFSWNVTWQPAANINSGTTILDFAMSFAGRFRQGA